MLLKLSRLQGTIEQIHMWSLQNFSRGNIMLALVIILLPSNNAQALLSSGLKGKDSRRTLGIEIQHLYLG